MSRLDSPCLATPKWQALSTPQTNVGPMCSPICSFHRYVTADTNFSKSFEAWVSALRLRPCHMVQRFQPAKDLRVQDQG